MKLTRILATFATTLLISHGAAAQVLATLSLIPSNPAPADTVEAIISGNVNFCPSATRPVEVIFTRETIMALEMTVDGTAVTRTLARYRF